MKELFVKVFAFVWGVCFTWGAITTIGSGEYTQAALFIGLFAAVFFLGLLIEVNGKGKG